MKRYLVIRYSFPKHIRGLPGEKLKIIFPFGVPHDLNEGRWLKRWYRGYWIFTDYDFDAKRFAQRWAAEDAIREASETDAGYYEIVETED